MGISAGKEGFGLGIILTIVALFGVLVLALTFSDNEKTIFELVGVNNDTLSTQEIYEALADVDDTVGTFPETSDIRVGRYGDVAYISIAAPLPPLTQQELTYRVQLQTDVDTYALTGGAFDPDSGWWHIKTKQVLGADESLERIEVVAETTDEEAEQSVASYAIDRTYHVLASGEVIPAYGEVHGGTAANPVRTYTAADVSATEESQIPILYTAPESCQSCAADIAELTQYATSLTESRIAIFIATPDQVRGHLTDESTQPLEAGDIVVLGESLEHFDSVAAFLATEVDDKTATEE